MYQPLLRGLAPPPPPCAQACPPAYLTEHELDAAKDDDELLQGDGGGGVEGLVERLHGDARHDAQSDVVTQRGDLQS